MRNLSHCPQSAIARTVRRLNAVVQRSLAQETKGTCKCSDLVSGTSPPTGFQLPTVHAVASMLNDGWARLDLARTTVEGRLNDY